MTTRIALPLALACSLLTACGGDSAASPGDSGGPAAATSYTPPGLDECPMVSNSDASTALGMAITFNPNEYSAVTCNLVPEPTTYGVGTITKMEGFDLETYLGNYFPSVTPGGFDDLGDESAWTIEGTTGRLWVQNGEDLIAIDLSWNQAGATADPAVHKARAEALARAVLANA